jgi:hypothetical protein
MMRTDAAVARLSELVCVAAGIKGPGGTPLAASDLMPWTDPHEVPDTVDNIAKLMRGERP